MTLNDIYQMLDPVAFSIGPFEVRWYGLAYIAGFCCVAASSGTIFSRTAAKKRSSVALVSPFSYPSSSVSYGGTSGL